MMGVVRDFGAAGRGAQRAVPNFFEEPPRARNAHDIRGCDAPSLSGLCIAAPRLNLTVSSRLEGGAVLLPAS